MSPGTKHALIATAASILLTFLIGWPLATIAGLVILVGLSLEHRHRMHAEGEPERIKRAVLAALEEREEAEWTRAYQARKQREADILAACPHQPNCVTHYIGPEITADNYRSYVESIPDLCRYRTERDAGANR